MVTLILILVVLSIGITSFIFIKSWINKKIEEGVNKKISDFQKQKEQEILKLQEIIQTLRTQRQETYTTFKKEQAQTAEITSDSFLINDGK